MAIEVFPDSPSSVGMSPRISFSHDLSHSDIVPVEQYIRSSSSSTSIDFDFCVFRESFDHDHYSISSADELFFDGKILPIEIKKRLNSSPTPPPKPPLPPPIISPLPPSSSKNETQEAEQKPNTSKSFWKFKRSASLNCGSGYARTLCPLPLLSRSNSTGSASNSSTKRSNSQKQNFLKQTSPNGSLKQTGFGPRPPLKKGITNSHASYCNGVKISPVLMVPPASMFGLGSFFSGGKDKSRKK